MTENDSNLDFIEFASELEILFQAPSETLTVEQSTEIIRFLKNQQAQGFRPIRNVKTRWDEIQGTALYFDLSQDLFSGKKNLKLPRGLKIQPSYWPSFREMETFLDGQACGIIRILLEGNSILLSFDQENGHLELFERF